jgi:hypothetical protein
MRHLSIAGRPLTTDDLTFIASVIAERPDWSRWALSRELAHRLGWRSPMGQLKDMACRELLVKLARDGLVAVPAPKRATPSPRRLRPPLPVVHSREPVACALPGVQPVSVSLVGRGTPEAELIRHLLVEYHYLGLDRTTGATVRYLVRSGDGRLLGCALWGSAAWKTAARDQWIGWTAQERVVSLGRVVDNTRYLILPWVRVPHLASHVLGLMTRRIAADWRVQYGTDVVLAETFVDVSRYAGTCYRAAGWELVGETAGRTRDDRQNNIQVPRKAILLKPLVSDWRRCLGLEGKP